MLKKIKLNDAVGTEMAHDVMMLPKSVPVNSRALPFTKAIPFAMKICAVFKKWEKIIFMS